MKKIIQIPIHKFAPYCFLEGQTGLNEGEEYLYRSLVYYREKPFVIDNLYEDPRRLASLSFLRPKTLVLGTTGVYVAKLNFLIELFFDLDMQGLENVIITSDTPKIVTEAMVKLKQQLPEVKFWELYEVPSKFDEQGERYSIYEIKP